MLNERELLKAATSHVLNGTKLERHNAFGMVLTSVVNTDQQLTTTKDTAVNIITKDGAEYHVSNFADKLRVKKQAIANFD